MSITEQNFFGAKVKVTADNLYCLNDIHRAAGTGSKKSPRHWLANKRTKSFIAADNENRIEQSHGGDMKGTYVNHGLAIHYANWASIPFFNRFLGAIGAAFNGDKEAMAKHSNEMNDPSINWFA